MLKKIFGFFFLLLIYQLSYSQQSSIHGFINDTTAKRPVANAVVALITPGDSTLTAFTRTATDGSYLIKEVPSGKYILQVMHPLFADYVEEVSVLSSAQLFPNIPLTAKSKLLEALILKSGSPMRVKGDTTIYTADSFKVSANANVEELLKKMPGFQVDKDGKIKQMGVAVEKVLVDGEEFFGDDPGMAVKNLRADAVKEVQVFDKKTDQAEFTGIDDGKSQKTINLKLKENKKTGYFGKIDLAGGLQKNIDDRYNNNILFSTFKGKRKLSGFLLNGNTGQDGLSWQDNDKYGGENDNITTSVDEDGGVMYMWRGGGTDDEPNINTENGFIKNLNAGVQYSNKWNDKQTFNLSPKYNSQDYNNNEQVYTRTNISPDTVYNQYSNNYTHIKRSNFKTSSTLDLKIDSNNSVKFTARANFYETHSNGISNSERRDIKNVFLNSSNINSRLDNNKAALTGNVIFRHKFKKARRTLSFTGDYNDLNSNGNNYYESEYNGFDTTGPYLLRINRMLDIEKASTKLSGRLVYTEPLSKKYSLELSHELATSNGTNNQVTYNYNHTTAKYEDQVDSLTNDFKTRIVVNTPGVKISYNNKKFKYNFGAAVGITNFDLEDKSMNKNYIRDYLNFFPSASMSYDYKSNHSLRINYNGYNTQPTINQLQPLRNNNDELNQYIGNPDLKPSFTNSINLNHFSSNFLAGSYMYQGVYVSLATNSITNSRTYSNGKTISQPINTDGNLNSNFYGGMSFKIKKIDTRLDINLNGGLTKFADVINGVVSHSNTLNSGAGFNLNKTKDKKYEISLGNNLAYFRNKTNQRSNSSSYIVNTINFNGTIYYKKIWSMVTSYQYYYRQKVNEYSRDLNTHLLNSTLQKTFKANEYTLYFTVRDILNQNIGIDRNFYGNNYTEQRNDRLKRYFLLGLKWDFKNKSTSATK